MYGIDYSNDIYHYGVLGMKWGVRNNKEQQTKKSMNNGDGDIIIKKGTEIHRIVPKSWVNNEKDYSGHAYASYKKEDTERYKHFAKMFGDGNNCIDMTFKAKETLVSPSRKKRVDEFIKLMDSDPKAKAELIKSTRFILFMPKSRLNKLNDPKQADKAYEKFSYLLVTKKKT